MNVNEAATLLRNLLDRVEEVDRGYQLVGLLTEGELNAIRVALAGLGEAVKLEGEELSLAAAEPTVETLGVDRSAIDVDLPKDVRICLDFGTAMSKATLVEDSGDEERVEVLQLGEIAGQQSSDYLLLSSVYISDDGVLMFGELAVERSYQEGLDGNRQRLDNIKRRMSEDGWEERVPLEYNPTKVDVTYGDMVLGYLTYFTWTASECAKKLGYGVLQRRFALPAFRGAKRREVEARLKGTIGKAQVLADTFGSDLSEGVPLARFMAGVQELASDNGDFPLVGEGLMEPAGVAGSMLSWRERQQSLVLIVDIGAGTSDLGLYRLFADPPGDGQFLEVEGSTRTLTQAGNYLDRILMEYLLKKGGVAGDDHRTRNRLNLRIRDYKETLFEERSVTVSVGALETGVEYDEFVGLSQVQQFTASIRSAMAHILESVDESWLDWVQAPGRALAVLMTGGCASLPVLRDLVGDEMDVGDRRVRTAMALSRPMWLDELALPAEVEYSRVAVALGGARRRMMDERVAKLTAGRPSPLSSLPSTAYRRQT